MVYFHKQLKCWWSKQNNHLHRLFGSQNLEQTVLRYVGTCVQCSATLMKYSFYYSVDVLYTVSCAFKRLYIFIHIIRKVYPLLFTWVTSRCHLLLKKETRDYLLKNENSTGEFNAASFSPDGTLIPGSNARLTEKDDNHWQTFDSFYELQSKTG